MFIGTFGNFSIVMSHLLFFGRCFENELLVIAPQVSVLADTRFAK